MNSIRLSDRLLMVASFVEQGAVVADIGSDHAYLPAYLIQKGIVKKAIAGEVAQGPFESAMGNVKREEIEDFITVRLANGLYAIEDGDGVDTVTIAGMGGSLIATILESGEKQLRSVKRIIAQPNIHAKAIREWAVAHEWKLVDEKVLKEDGKIYEVLVLEKGKAMYDELELLVGPYLSAECSHVFREKWESEMMQWLQVLLSIEHAEKTPATIKKKEQLTRHIGLVGKVLA